MNNSDIIMPAKGFRKMELSIIIVSHNTRDTTRNCLQSIHNANLQLTYEIIVIDNASSDGSVEMFREEFPNIRLIANDNNNMFAKANNQGMAIAQGAVFLLLNSDTIIESGNLEKLYRYIKEFGDEVGCVGPVILNADQTVQSQGSILPSFRDSFSRFFKRMALFVPIGLRSLILPAGHKYYPQFAGANTVGWIHGPCMMFSSKTWKKVGDLDEYFEFYSEEVDFCRRIWDVGLKVQVLPSAKIVHLGGMSTSDQNWAKEKDLLGQARYMKKHFSWIGSRLNLLVLLIGHGTFSRFHPKKEVREHNKYDYKKYRAILRHLSSV